MNQIRAESGSEDLTFTMPRYLLVVISKYDMLKRVAQEEGGGCRILRIDASLSRFFRQDMTEGKLSLAKSDRLRNAAFAATGPSGASDRFSRESGRPGRRLATTDRRCDMYATEAGAIDTASRLYRMVEQHWLPRVNGTTNRSP